MSVDYYEEKWKKWKDMKIYGPASRHIRRLILDMIKNIDFNSVIDIGCGEGSLLQLLALEKYKYNLYGCDISEKAIELASSKLSGEFRVLNIERTYLNRMFDLAICSEVLEHIQDDIQALKNTRKMCKNVIITVPSGKMDKVDKQMGHFRRYSKKELTSKLKQAGFKILQIREWGFPFYSPIYRTLIRYTSEDMRSGEFGILKKIISYLWYQIFLLNIFDKGDRIVVLATAINDE